MTSESTFPSQCAHSVQNEELSSSQIYHDALQRLNRLRTNFESRKEMIGASSDRDHLLQQMVKWCKEIGYQRTDFDALNAIHIAGSKGKGSTAAFVFSILSEYLSKESAASDQAPMPIKKLGLYTSPHLRSVRERIRLRGSRVTDFAQTALNEEKFARYLTEVWNRLGIDNRKPSHSPPFAKFLTLMGLHTFLEEKVDTAVVEVGIGGRYDSTNVLHRPSVCAISSLGLEHTDILGSTIEEIAWSKAGIMKSGAPAFTVPQEPSAMAVLEEQARKEGVDLQVINVHPDLEHLELGLKGDFQRINASLAMAVAAAHLRHMGCKEIPETSALMQSPLSDKFRRGLINAQWPGRCEMRNALGVRWLLDGAHTIESIGVLGPWVAEVIEAQRQACRVLIFNQQTKDAAALLRHLHQVMVSSASRWVKGEEPLFHQAIFCTNIPWERYKVHDIERVSMMYSGGSKVEDLKAQRELAALWTEITRGESSVTVVRTVEEAVECAASNQNVMYKDEGHVKAAALITGSLHLVGSALEVLDAIA
ncbi:hypothetical protein BBP40_002804 [Aspergillus hancockii]|nr:hypothetical protein BBP40_002804 [Aspergillus hancockii]